MPFRRLARRLKAAAILCLAAASYPARGSKSVIDEERRGSDVAISAVAAGRRGSAVSVDNGAHPADNVRHTLAAFNSPANLGNGGKSDVGIEKQRKFTIAIVGLCIAFVLPGLYS